MLLKDQILKFYKEEYRLNPKNRFGRMKVALHLKINGYINDASNITVTGIRKIIELLYREGHLEQAKDSYYYRYIPQKKVIKLKLRFNATNNN